MVGMDEDVRHKKLMFRVKREWIKKWFGDIGWNGIFCQGNFGKKVMHFCCHFSILYKKIC